MTMHWWGVWLCSVIALVKLILLPPYWTKLEAAIKIKTFVGGELDVPQVMIFVFDKVENKVISIFSFSYVHWF